MANRNQWRSSVTNKHDLVDYQFNIILIGDSGVGKTSLINRFTRDVFIPLVDATIGMEFRTKTIDIPASLGHNSGPLIRVKLQFWDTAGHDRLRCLTKNFYRNADAIFFVYDVTNIVTFRNIQDWMTEANEHTDPRALRWLVGNKIDCPAEMIAVSRSQLERFVLSIKTDNAAVNTGVTSIQASAKSGNNVENVFLDLTRQLVEQETHNSSVCIGNAISAGKSSSLLRERSNSHRKKRDRSSVLSVPDQITNYKCCKI